MSARPFGACLCQMKDGIQIESHGLPPLLRGRLAQAHREELSCSRQVNEVPTNIDAEFRRPPNEHISVDIVLLMLRMILICNPMF